MAGVVTINRSDACNMIAEILQNQGSALSDVRVEIIDDKEENCDVGIIIALQEEFNSLFPRINPIPRFLGDVNQYYFLFTWDFENGVKYKCVATFMSGMGPTKAALATDRLARNFSPKTIVNIGIAGSMDKDVKVGDVVVAEQADDYLHQSKAIKTVRKGQYELVLSGDPYKTSPSHVEHARNLMFAHKEAVDSWALEANQFLKGIVADRARFGLFHNDLVKEYPQIKTGNIASSTVVASAAEFCTWLKLRDRKYLAIEMEAAGVLTAAYGREIQTLIIRGISDFSDDRKQQLDELGGGSLRKYAMNNALSVLEVFLKKGFLLRG